MPITPQEALEELRKRGYSDEQLNSMGINVSESAPAQQFSKEEAIAELKKRGYSDNDIYPGRKQFEAERETFFPESLYGPRSEEITPGQSIREEITPGQSIREDITKLAGEAPGELLEIGKSLGKGIADVPSTLFSEPTRLPRTAMAALGQAGQSIANIPSNIARYLGEKGISPEAMQSFSQATRAPEIDFKSELFGVEGDRPSDVLGQVAGELPVWAVGGGPAFRASRVLGMSTEKGSNPFTAALGELTPSALKAAGETAKSLKPSAIIAARYGKDISPAELSSRLTAAEGTPTQLGTIIESPALKHAFENWTSKVPFSEGEALLKEAGKGVEAKATKAVNDLHDLAGSKADTNYIMERKLADAFKNAEKQKRAMYKPVNEMVAQEGIKFEMKNFKKLADDSLKTLEESPLLKSDPDLSKGLRKIVSTKVIGEAPRGILDKFGRSITEASPPTSKLVDLQMYATKLAQEASRSEKSPNAIDRSNAKLYKEASQNIREDIRDTLKNKGSKELQEAYQEAQANYAENFAPFLEGDIYKLIHSTKDAQDLARRIVQPGAKADRFATIKKVQDLLPVKDRNLLGYTMLKNAINEHGVVDIRELNKGIKSLGPRQFEALFPDPATRVALRNVSKLASMNSEALNIMYNPKTGYRHSSPVIKSIMGSTIAASGAFGGIPGALGGLAKVGSVIGASKAFNVLMTSEKFRNAVAREIRLNQAKYKGKKVSEIEIPDSIRNIATDLLSQNPENGEEQNEIS